jgi:hypothetical protein
MKKAGLLIVAFGMLLHAYIAFFKAEGGASNFSMGLMVWSWLPYLVCALFFLVTRRPLIPLFGVVLPAIMDTLNFYSVFISPQSSTAALGLLWMPLWNLVLFMPVGLVIGWAIARRKTSNSRLEADAP